ncbi:RNA polymerase sigma factor SigM [Thalassiella azotivora]
MTWSGEHGRTGDAPEDDRERDRRLLAAHVAGDPDAFSDLVRLHQRRLWAVALRTLGDPEEAADAVQDAMVSAFRSAHTYRGDAAVTTWLHRVVVNACLDRVRRAKARPTVPLPERDVATHRDEHAATETRVDVVAALARIPEHQRTALVLVDVQDLSVAEAAQVLGVAEGTVKSRCARGRAALLEVLRGPRSPSDPEPGRRNPAATPDVPPAGSGPPSNRGAGSPDEPPDEPPDRPTDGPPSETARDRTGTAAAHQTGETP